MKENRSGALVRSQTTGLKRFLGSEGLEEAREQMAVSWTNDAATRGMAVAAGVKAAPAGLARVLGLRGCRGARWGNGRGTQVPQPLGFV